MNGVPRQETERPAVEIVLRGTMFAGRTELMGVIYEALRSKGINVDAFEGGLGVKHQVIPASRGGRYDGRRVVLVDEGVSLPRKCAMARGSRMGRRGW